MFHPFLEIDIEVELEKISIAFLILHPIPQNFL